MSRRHVVLLTYGEPPRPAFLAQLRYSWRILLGLTRSVADIPAVALPIIAAMRAWTRVALWRAERFESPLEPITRAQASTLLEALVAAAPGVEWRVHVAYEFRDPLLGDTIERLPADEPVDVVPMYAADSAFTHELARQTLEPWAHRHGARPRRIRVLPPLPVETQAELAAGHVRRTLAARGLEPGRDWALVLAAHGTLLDPPRPYETGREATERLSRAIALRLGGEFGCVQLGWLNHAFGGRWTEPPADQALRQVAEAGYRRVVYFPFGFLADNAETVLEGRIALRTRPELEAVHLPCLDAAPELMAALAAQIIGPDVEVDRHGGERAVEPASHDGSAPAPNGKVPRHARPASGGEARLDQLEPGEESVIRRLEGERASVRRLMELGLVPGTTVELVRRAPFGDPLQLRFRAVSLSIRRTEASRIHVARR